MQAAAGLVIDTDGGADDAVALCLALQSGKVVAVTTVSGNVHVDQATENVGKILDACHIADGVVPFYKGAADPLVGRWVPPHWDGHGRDGLGDADPVFPVSTRHCHCADEAAAVALVRLFSSRPGELALVTLGPMTNIARALELDPTLPTKVHSLVWMGGTTDQRGNTTSVAEFNIFADPEAAEITLAAFPNSVMASWELAVSTGMATTWNWFDSFTSHSHHLSQFFRRISGPWERASRPREGNVGQPNFTICDAVAVALALRPTLERRSEQHWVAVETGGKYCRGMTVIDYYDWHHANEHKPRNCRVVLEIDNDAYAAMLFALFEWSVEQGQ